MPRASAWIRSRYPLLRLSIAIYIIPRSTLNGQLKSCIVTVALALGSTEESSPFFTVNNFMNGIIRYNRYNFAELVSGVKCD